MTMQTLRDAHKAQPFRPFTLRLADGRALPVRHPENCAYSDGRTAVVMQGDGYAAVDLLLVVSLDFESSAAPTETETR